MKGKAADIQAIVTRLNAMAVDLESGTLITEDQIHILSGLLLTTAQFLDHSHTLILAMPGNLQQARNDGAKAAYSSIVKWLDDHADSIAIGEHQSLSPQAALRQAAQRLRRVMRELTAAHCSEGRAERGLHRIASGR
jgi:hypothetical protein